MELFQNFFERENWLIELMMIPISLTYISLIILILTEASNSNNFLRATDITVSGVLSLLLVFLYFRQNSILGNQTNIQDEQTDILRASETPEIVMNGFLFLPKDGERESHKIGAKFSNTGNGLAKNFEITTTLQLPTDSELKGEKFPRGLKREENSDIRGLAGDYIRSGEMGECLTAELALQIRKPIDGQEGWMHTYEFEEAVDRLTEEGIDNITIVWDIEWTDTFGRSKDAFGNEYKEQHFRSGEIREGTTFEEFMMPDGLPSDTDSEDS
jgi:hypothetical protein